MKATHLGTAVLRDDLLGVASVAVVGAQRAELDPARVLDLVVGAWQAAHPEVPVTERGGWDDRPQVVTDLAFRRHRSGVEGLAFAVLDGQEAPAGGMILRFPGDYPDSFEPVELDGGVRTAAAVWSVYFPDDVS